MNNSNKTDIIINPEKCVNCAHCCLSTGICGTRQECEEENITIEAYFLYAVLFSITILMIIVVRLALTYRRNRKTRKHNQYSEFLASLSKARLKTEINPGVFYVKK